MFCNLHIFADNFREYQPIQEKRIDDATSCPTIVVVSHVVCRVDGCGTRFYYFSFIISSTRFYLFSFDWVIIPILSFGFDD